MQLPVLPIVATLCATRGIHISKSRTHREVIKQRAARDPLSFIVVQWRARLEEPKFPSYMLVHC